MISGLERHICQESSVVPVGESSTPGWFIFHGAISLVQALVCGSNRLPLVRTEQRKENLGTMS